MSSTSTLRTRLAVVAAVLSILATVIVASPASANDPLENEDIGVLTGVVEARVDERALDPTALADPTAEPTEPPLQAVPADPGATPGEQPEPRPNPDEEPVPNEDGDPADPDPGEGPTPVPGETPMQTADVVERVAEPRPRTDRPTPDLAEATAEPAEKAGVVCRWGTVREPASKCAAQIMNPTCIHKVFFILGREYIVFVCDHLESRTAPSASALAAGPDPAPPSTSALVVFVQW